jgi:protein-L-isoaspartate O-methyltransferase
MGLYKDRILPTLIDLSMRNRVLRPYRERVVAAAEGRVLEIGIGSGLNLPLYSTRVENVVGLDPSRQLLERARKRTQAGALSIRPAAARSKNSGGIRF